MKYPLSRHRAGLFIISVALAGALLPAAPASAQTQLLTNGGFETNGGYGTSAFAGWTTATLMSPQTGAAGFFVGDNTQTPVIVGQDANGNDIVLNTPTTPINGLPTVGAKSGNFYAVTDSDGGASNALLQSFTVPTGATQVTLSFSLFVNARDGAGAQNTGGTLDYSQATPTQFARVDLLSSSALPFSTASGDVIRNFYAGVDPTAGPNPLYPTPYTTYSFDITSSVVRGQTYQIRIADVGNQFILNTGVDDVSVLAIGPAVGAPEPASAAFVLLGFAALAARRRKRIASSKKENK